MYYENFQKLCENFNVTPGAVSKETGVATSTLTSWKKGHYTPKDDKLQKIADFFSVPLDYLKYGEVKSGYYLNEETANVAQEIFDNPDLRILFDAAKDAKPETLRAAAALLKSLKETNPYG